MGILRKLLLLVSLLPAVSPAEAVMQTVLEADRAFAELSRERGPQAAFETFLAPGSVLFRPMAVDGLRWIADHEQASGQLQWSPIAAAASCSGDYALTTGRWQYLNETDGASADGFYLTLWRQDPGGRWRVVLDHGINAGGDDDEVGPGLAEALESFWPSDQAGNCTKVARQEHAERAERRLNSRITARGPAAAREDFLWPQAIVYRENHAPGQASQAWPEDSLLAGRPVELRTQGWLTGSGDDFSVSFGEVLAPVGPSESGAAVAVYVRIWAPVGRRWRVAVDMLVPFPAEAASD